MVWRDDLHPRDERGRFTSGMHIASRNADGSVRRERDPAGHTRPQVVSAQEFDQRIPFANTLYRGVNGDRAADAAAATRAGTLGGGDLGRGLYFTRSIDLAVVYTQQHSGDNRGRIVRAGLPPEAKVALPADLPRNVREHGDISGWVAGNGFDAYRDITGTVLVVNPQTLLVDSADYTADEALAASDRRNGYV